MSWGIAETAPEIEKIKAESADYLGGLNSCGEIKWWIYSQAFDFYADLIQKAYELGKTEAKPRWIPVTENTLPEKHRVVVVCGDKGTWDFGTYRGHSDNIHYWHWKKNTYKRVYWWMYKEDALPEPYKEVTT